MNKTERKARAWLKKQGKEVVFQSRNSPDFICKDGEGYEIKLLRRNTITFSTSQYEVLKKFSKQLTILVFNGHDDPLHIIPFGELANQPHYWHQIRLRVYDFGAGYISIRKVTPSLFRKARIDAAKHKQTVGMWMDDAIRLKLGLKRK